ncbi:hypothetical protein ACHHYP_04453 [Achlya hypogyna]|uniref:B box-type domain-containing protein n=1 Tax=Achlya hypogyna TaxID=1202772 RepID=A0A1V9Z0Y8_ACHHY|nr:hypothetical protein ACHHYP_04453 [Achlya hypogyna]
MATAVGHPTTATASKVCGVCEEFIEGCLCLDCDLSFCVRCFDALHRPDAVRSHRKQSLVAPAPAPTPAPMIEASPAGEELALKNFNAINERTVHVEAEINKLREAYSTTPSSGIVALTENIQTLQNSMDPLYAQREEAFANVFARSPTLRARLSELGTSMAGNTPQLWPKAFEKLNAMAGHFDQSAVNIATIQDHLCASPAPQGAQRESLLVALDQTNKYMAKLQADRYAECIKIFMACETLRTKVLRFIPLKQ